MLLLLLCLVWLLLGWVWLFCFVMSFRVRGSRGGRPLGCTGTGFPLWIYGEGLHEARGDGAVIWLKTGIRVLLEGLSILGCCDLAILATAEARTGPISSLVGLTIELRLSCDSGSSGVARELCAGTVTFSALTFGRCFGSDCDCFSLRWHNWNK